MGNLVYNIDDKNKISYRLTPWDQRSFGFKTSELLTIYYDNVVNLDKLISHFHNFNVKEDVVFAYTRIDSNDFFLKSYLQKEGFYFAETSLEIRKINLLNYDEDTRLFKAELSKATHADFEEIRLIAKDSFNYSRFHEDVNIDRNGAMLRYYYWIDDLIKQGKEIYVCKIEDEIIGFHIHEISGDTAHIVLTGCKKGKSAFSPSLWQEALLILKKRKVRRVETLISASNIGVLNLYIYLEFKVVRTLLGMHIFYK